jgi:hypothetical protein
VPLQPNQSTDHRLWATKKLRHDGGDWGDLFFGFCFVSLTVATRSAAFMPQLSTTTISSGGAIVALTRERGRVSWLCEIARCGLLLCLQEGEENVLEKIGTQEEFKSEASYQSFFS